MFPPEVARVVSVEMNSTECVTSLVTMFVPAAAVSFMSRSCVSFGIASASASICVTVTVKTVVVVLATVEVQPPGGEGTASQKKELIATAKASASSEAVVAVKVCVCTTSRTASLVGREAIMLFLRSATVFCDSSKRPRSWPFTIVHFALYTESQAKGE